MSDYQPITPNQIYTLDALTLLKTMPSESVNCIVTSPPYYSLRDYGVEGQMGLEPTLKEFIENMTTLFREARRVLRFDGTCWVNLGDTYAGNRGSGSSPSMGEKQKSNPGSHLEGKTVPDGLKSKDLMGVPWRLAFALQDDGWYLRQDIIWAKPNPMPESVEDRCTKSHEYVFLMTKSERYWFDSEAIREDCVDGDTSYPRGSKGNADKPNAGRRLTGGGFSKAYAGAQLNHGGDSERKPYTKRNKRSVWIIPTEPTPYAHFATFPQALITPMILAGCPKEVCSVCGAPYERVTEDTPEYAAIKETMLGNTHVVNGLSNGKGQGYGSDKARVAKQTLTTGFRPTCTCHASTRPGIVYDPFMGSGTTAIVAQRNGRSYVGSELNFEYVQIARGRLKHFDPKEFKREIKGEPSTIPLFGALP